jgi:subtilisin family serine protease
VVAVMDNGVDIDHRDLRGNFPDGSSDTSDNGYSNDAFGWDFFDNDNDPRPSNGFDNHGTRVAGVIAANRGSRDGGALGGAYTCTLMALKVAKGDPQDPASWASDAQMAEAILYAAGFHADGVGRWHGADVINISLTLVPKWEINEALHKAATQGRQGKGCPIFCSSGNDSDGWTSLAVSGFQSGRTYTFRWQYAKKPTGSSNRGTVWLDSVIFPDREIEGFEKGIPSGWKTTGSANWSSVQDGVDGNHAMTGWDGQHSRSVRAGSIGANQFCLLELTRTVREGSMQFWYWPAMESGEQFDFVIVQGSTEVYRETLTPDYRTQDYIPYIPVVAYPALHPDTIGVGASTNFDYRADYSRYGFGLDFVAPSGGGSESIYTTDRTDTSVQFGDDGNYTYFSGTSAASPLAAAVGALMLSANPDLTAQEVRDIMQETCDPIGNAPYNEINDSGFNTNSYFGHGRINAGLAVTAAKEMAGK